MNNVENFFKKELQALFLNPICVNILYMYRYLYCQVWTDLPSADGTEGWWWAEADSHLQGDPAQASAHCSQRGCASGNMQLHTGQF